MNFSLLIKQLYTPPDLLCKNIQSEPESKEYDAHQCIINNKKVLFRTAKITPTKEGQFVTLWKRSPQGPIIPYDRTDDFDIVIINSNENHKSGQFIFNKNVLLKNKVISNNNIGGK